MKTEIIQARAIPDFPYYDWVLVRCLRADFIEMQLKDPSQLETNLMILRDYRTHSMQAENSFRRRKDFHPGIVTSSSDTPLREALSQPSRIVILDRHNERNERGVSICLYDDEIQDKAEVPSLLTIRTLEGDSSSGLTIKADRAAWRWDRSSISDFAWRTSLVCLTNSAAQVYLLRYEFDSQGRNIGSTETIGAPIAISQ